MMLVKMKLPTYFGNSCVKETGRFEFFHSKIPQEASRLGELLIQDIWIWLLCKQQ